jgi:hypothetical protein
MRAAGGYTIADLMEGFSVGRANRLQGREPRRNQHT